MKYKLKNKKLHEFLTDNFYNFDFVFQEACRSQYHDKSAVVTVYFEVEPVTSITLYKSGICEQAEYNPNGWNEYPAVTPPEGVIMRVEAGVNGDRRDIKTSAVFVDGKWCEPNIKRDPSLIGAWITRFRPWEDD